MPARNGEVDLAEHQAARLEPEPPNGERACRHRCGRGEIARPSHGTRTRPWKRDRSETGERMAIWQLASLPAFHPPGAGPPPDGGGLWLPMSRTNFHSPSACFRQIVTYFP